MMFVGGKVACWVRMLVGYRMLIECRMLVVSWSDSPTTSIRQSPIDHERADSARDVVLQRSADQFWDASPVRDRGDERGELAHAILILSARQIHSLY
jgi:hypothetical protein